MLYHFNNVGKVGTIITFTSVQYGDTTFTLLDKFSIVGKFCNISFSCLNVPIVMFELHSFIAEELFSSTVMSDSVLYVVHVFVHITVILLELLRGEEKAVVSCMYSLDKLISLHHMSSNCRTQEI